MMLKKHLLNIRKIITKKQKDESDYVKISKIYDKCPKLLKRYKKTKF